jgi:hypothetical protein
MRCFVVSIVYGREIQSCGAETGTRLLGRCTTKCGIILKCKKYKMSTWTGFVWHKTERIEAFIFYTTVTIVAALEIREICLLAEKIFTV